MLLWIVLFLLVEFCPSVGADQDSDEDVDLLLWTTVNNNRGIVPVYENVNLQESSFLAVCLGHQFQRKSSLDGLIFLESSGSKYVKLNKHVLIVFNLVLPQANLIKSIRFTMAIMIHDA